MIYFIQKKIIIKCLQVKFSRTPFILVDKKGFVWTCAFPLSFSVLIARVNAKSAGNIFQVCSSLGSSMLYIKVVSFWNYGQYGKNWNCSTHEINLPRIQTCNDEDGKNCNFFHVYWLKHTHTLFFFLCKNKMHILLSSKSV